MSDDGTTDASRRQFVAASATAAIGGLAGCVDRLSGRGGSDPTASGSGTGTAPSSGVSGTDTETPAGSDGTAGGDGSASIQTPVEGTWAVPGWGTPDGTSRVPQGGPTPPLTKVWSQTVQTDGLLLGRGHIVGSRDGEMTALDAATGEHAWQRSGTASFLADGAVFSWKPASTVRAVETGETLWQTGNFSPGLPDESATYGILTPSDSRSFQGRPLQKRAARGGDLQWTMENPTDEEMFMLRTVDADSGLLFASLGDELLAIDTASGEERWRVPKAEVLFSANEHLYLHDGRNGVIKAIPFGDTSAAWEQSVGSPETMRVATDGTRVFVYTSPDRLRALDAATGDQRWSARLAGECSTLFVGGGTVFAGEYAYEGTPSSGKDAPDQFVTELFSPTGERVATVDGVTVSFVSESALFGVDAASRTDATLAGYVAQP